MLSQPLRFLVCGAIAACVNLVVRWLLDRWLSFELAVVVAYAAGMVTAFLLMRAFVFEPSRHTLAGEFARFTTVNAAALPQTIIVSYVLHWVLPVDPESIWRHRDEFAHLAGVAVPMVSSYFGHRYFSFAPRTGKTDAAGPP